MYTNQISDCKHRPNRQISRWGFYELRYGCGEIFQYEPGKPNGSDGGGVSPNDQVHFS